MQIKMYTTQQVADLSGIHKDTLLRWLKKNNVPEPARDGHGWRIFTHDEAEAISLFANSKKSIPVQNSSTEISRLKEVDWDFSAAKTNYLTHSIHPYPAKYIPQIPNALIQELSHVGETIADIFCGSGTTLLEALQLKRNAVGIDANPLAALISSAKTTPLNDHQILLLEKHISVCETFLQSILQIEQNSSDSLRFKSSHWRPDAKVSEFWFAPHVVEELAELRFIINSIEDGSVRTLCQVSLSAIIVTVSKQDSDTRYVRREKSIKFGDTVKKYITKLKSSKSSTQELSDLIENRFSCSIYNNNILHAPETEPFDLVVTSPPYPNAFSYHLYHRTRMLWLGHDQAKFKKEEIGSHRKYSSKAANAANEETFRNEFETIFQWLRGRLKDNRHACFVIGDSTIRGERIDNASLLSDVASKIGFKEVARLDRSLLATKKSFNPKIGKIRTEKILVLKKV